MDEKNMPKADEKIVPRIIEEEMKQSYLAYSMSVIVGRALPDVRDGLKPVHRRVLYAMYDMGMLHNKPFKKSARIVGEVLGKYHPHGDVAVYDTMVRMVQDFSLRYPLIQGQGNFGSIDGDNPAAMRYTEARLNKLAEEMLQDIDKETVDFVPNFDASLKEPSVIPSKVPNLLINGSSGIAVGMATNIPPHNMAEIVDAIIAQIGNPDISIEELMQYVQGPDFPTGALICGRNGIKNAYATGKGKITIRSKTKLEEGKKKKIIVTEIPYMVNKAMLVEEIADCIRDKKVQGIHDLRDESDREGIRIVLDLKQDADANVVLNQLYQHTRMQVTFGVIMLALVNSKPEILTLKDFIQNYILHRQAVVRKRTQFDLARAQQRSHILEGLIIALNNIDPAIKMIKESKSAEIARQALMNSYTLSLEQANAILDMKLQRLTSLEQEKIREEHKGLLQLIEELKSVLASEEKILGIIRKELQELKENYGDERRTEIIDLETTELNVEDLIKEQDMVITITHSGYIKRLPLDTYKKQRRGGKGVIATGTKEEDYVEDIFVARTHSHILFFTNKGKVHWLKVYEIPEASRQAQGKAIINLLSLEEGEKINAFVPVQEFNNGHYIVMVSKHGIIKKTALNEFSNPRRGGIIACTLKENDELVSVRLTNGQNYLIIGTKQGIAVHFHEETVRAMGRAATGVRGIRLEQGDEVIGMVVVEKDKTLLTITENGFGKRTPVEEYRETNRGGKGVINIKTKYLYPDSKNEGVVAVISVSEDDEVMFISQNGIAIRTPVNGISAVGRATQGVRLMKLEENDRVVSATKIVTEKKEEKLEQEKPAGLIAGENKLKLGFEAEPVFLPSAEEKLILPKEEENISDSPYAPHDVAKKRYDDMMELQKLLKKRHQDKPI